MLRSDYKGQNCSVARALEVVGERWTLLIVRDLLAGARRFEQLQRNLGIARNVLTNRLEKLVDLGIVERRRYTEAREWYDYRLTEKGRDLFPVISALMSWGDRYAAPNGPPALVEHVGCGHSAGHALVCSHCREAVDVKRVRLVPGPGTLQSRTA